MRFKRWYEAPHTYQAAIFSNISIASILILYCFILINAVATLCHSIYYLSATEYLLR